MSASSTILIIEDDEDIIYLLSYVIKEAGFNAISSSPDLYIDHIDFHSPRLILLDYWLPNALGSDICISLKANPKTKHIPIILVSAVTGINEVAKACLADDVLAKPFDIDDLERKIVKWLTPPFKS